ncbi:MAG: heme anaerobic degradation radical SAM methyltransferase ChuW/HutW [Parvibaculum sp.]|nr:heme anaerobic degradation radical SAM methyltransferase ChuW/HutW [Parvibaculum sp.]
MSAIDLTRFFANTNGDAIGHAFAARRAVMPWSNRRPLMEDDIATIWPHLLMDCGTPRQRLVYIHVPFCANHCLFCGFYRNAYTAPVAATYADRVVAEIEREADEAGIRHHPIEAVYLGGGTPSALSAEDLTRILDTVRQRLPLAPDCEITLEGRIIHFDDKKIDACISAGVNRISVGVQTFDTTVRRRQGRRASKEEAIRFLEGIRDRNSVTLVIDLLYGLSGQTMEVWREDLRIVGDLAPDGVDLYGLNLIPGTPLQRAVAAGKLHPMTLPHLGAMYEAGAAFLSAKGWRQISNSHWARTPHERNRYNLRIKQGADCLAYGSGAGGTIGRYSYNIAGDLQEYGDGVAAGRKPIGGMSISDDFSDGRHYVTSGFEIGHLDLGGLDVPHIPDARARFAPLLEQWQRAGLMVVEGDVARLTLPGRFWYSNLIAAFNDIITATGPASDTKHEGRPPPLNNRPKTGETA